MSAVDSATRVSPEIEAQRPAPFPPLTVPTPRVPPSAKVKLCYTLMHVAESAGIRDLADGEFLAPDETLEQGIIRQNNELLDQVGCTRPGFRLLEIGCGYGRLLSVARERGADAVGVNLSPEQVRCCNDQGLQAFCCNYRDLLTAADWHGRFDGVIANGSLEHWVQPEDVRAGQMNDIYRESFEIAFRALDPTAADARYVTTALHVRSPLSPDDLLAPWYRLPRGSDRRQFSLLHHWFGGYYPVFGQLEECARPYFQLTRQTDGTLGYKIASELRMKRMLHGMATKPRVLWGIAKVLARHPWATSTLLNGYFIEQAWDWQFRGDPPPTTLLRQTWTRTRPTLGESG